MEDHYESSSDSDQQSSTDEASDLEQEKLEDEIVNVTFDCKAPQSTDFTALKKMMSPLFPDCLPLSQMVDDVLEQACDTGFGCSVYIEDGQDDDDDEDEDEENQEPIVPDPIALVSIIDVKQEMTDWLKDNLKMPKDKHMQKQSLNDIKRCFVNCRLINLPFDIVPLAFTSLLTDLQNKSSEHDENENDELIMYMSRMYSVGKSDKQWHHYQPEDEHLQKRAVLECAVKASSKIRDAAFEDNKIASKTVCLLLTYKSLIEALTEIAAMQE